MSKTIFCTIIIVLAFCTSKLSAQGFLNLDANNSQKKEYLLSKINKNLLSSNSIFLNNNQFHYGKNSTSLELNYNEIFAISKLSKKSKSEIETIIIRINANETSFDLSQLNQLENLEIVYLLIEFDISEKELVSKLTNISNWAIIYKISIPE